LQQPDQSHTEADSSDQTLDDDHGPNDDQFNTGHSALIQTPQASEKTASEKPRARTSDPFRDYMTLLGFRWDQGSRTFSHDDGRIVRPSDGLFHWVLSTAAGEIHPIWIASTSLDSAKGVEIPAEVWNAA